MQVFDKYGKIIIILLTLISILYNDIAFGANSNLKPNKYAALVLDADSGKILYQENAGKERYPASLVKMMTLYIAFDALEKNKLKLNQQLVVSQRASQQPRSKLGLKKGEKISVRDTIMGLIIKSANDAAMVLAENIGGNEKNFADLMNKYAKMLGMEHTKFVNPSGLHNVNQKTTAYDMARLAMAIRRDFKKYYYLFSKNEFKYKNEVHESHNHITKTYFGADGLKTGFTNASGYNIVSTAQRGNKRLIVVVMGGMNAKARDTQVAKLMNKFFVMPNMHYAVGGNYIKANNSQNVKFEVPIPKAKPSIVKKVQNTKKLHAKK